MTTQEIMTAVKSLNISESFDMALESVGVENADFLVKSDYMLGQMSDKIKWSKLDESGKWLIPVQAKTNRLLFEVIAEVTATGLNVYRMKYSVNIG